MKNVDFFVIYWLQLYLNILPKGFILIDGQKNLILPSIVIYTVIEVLVTSNYFSDNCQFGCDSRSDVEDENDVLLLH